MVQETLRRLALSPNSRALECQQAVIMIMISVAVLLTPDTVAKGAFKYMISLGWSPLFFAIVMLITGAVRIWALWINGTGQPYGPRVRAFTALIGAVIWLQMSFSLFILTKDTQTLSIGTGVWATMALFELYSCYRAGIDVWSARVEAAHQEQQQKHAKENA